LVKLKSLGLAESTLRSYWYRLETIATHANHKAWFLRLFAYTV